MLNKIKAWFEKHPVLLRNCRIIIGTVKSFADYEISAMGAQLAYYSIVAFFTLGITVVYASSLIPAIYTGAGYVLESIFPPSIISLFSSTIKQIDIPKKIFPMVSTAVMSVWFASRAIRSMMRSFDTIYNAVHRRKSYQRTYLSVLFTLVFEVLFASIFIFSVLGKTISKSILPPLEISDQFALIFTYIRLIFPAVLMLFTFWLFYYYLTNVKFKFRQAFPGALFTTILWLVISKFFSLYFLKISMFPLVLGSVGGIFVFLIWIFWCSIIVLVGAVLNHRFMQWRSSSSKDTNPPPESQITAQ